MKAYTKDIIALIYRLADLPAEQAAQILEEYKAEKRGDHAAVEAIFSLADHIRLTDSIRAKQNPGYAQPGDC